MSDTPSSPDNSGCCTTVSRTTRSTRVGVTTSARRPPTQSSPSSHATTSSESRSSRAYRSARCPWAHPEPRPWSEPDMKVLLLGSGGREHAIGWKLVQSPLITRLISCPGNPGLAEIGDVVPDVDPEDPDAVTALAQDRQVDLVVVGPEGPLAAGSPMRCRRQASRSSVRRGQEPCSKLPRPTPSG